VVNGEKKKSGLIRKYGLNMSRQAFREKAADMGWVKVSTYLKWFVDWGLICW
jgi:small subunit ribosomal protein S29e